MSTLSLDGALEQVKLRKLASELGMNNADKSGLLKCSTYIADRISLRTESTLQDFISLLKSKEDESCADVKQQNRIALEEAFVCCLKLGRCSTGEKKWHSDVHGMVFRDLNGDYVVVHIDFSRTNLLYHPHYDYSPRYYLNSYELGNIVFSLGVRGYDVDKDFCQIVGSDTFRNFWLQKIADTFNLNERQLHLYTRWFT